MAVNPFTGQIESFGPQQGAPIAGQIPLGAADAIAKAQALGGGGGAAGFGGGGPFQGYIPQGFAMMLSRLAQNPQFQQMLQHGMLANRLQQFGLSPDQITAPGFDPNQLYNRGMARADTMAGVTPLAAGSMVPQGYTPAPTYHPLQMPMATPPHPLTPLAPNLNPQPPQPQGFAAPIGMAPQGGAGGGSMPQTPGRRVYGQGGPANSY